MGASRKLERLEAQRDRRAAAKRKCSRPSCKRPRAASVAADTSQASRTIRLNTFQGAYDHVPLGQDDVEWPEVGLAVHERQEHRILVEPLGERFWSMEAEDLPPARYRIEAVGEVRLDTSALV